MLQYSPSLSWTDGVFLRPHHFQQVQQGLALARSSERSLALPYAYGLAHLDIDETALEHFHFSIQSLQAILPGGTEVDLPRNAEAEALDLTPELSTASTLTVYLAVPPLREGEGNVAGDEAAGAAPRRFTAEPQMCYDLNAGGNEQPIMFRRLKLLLSTRPEALPGYEKLPLMRLVCHRSADGRPSLSRDASYMAPSLTLSAAPELLHRLEALCSHLSHIATNLVTSLREREMQTQARATERLEKMLKCGLLQSSLQALRQLAAIPSATPQALYTELCRLLMQLAAFRPLEDVPEPALYRHDDCLPLFTEVMEAIYRLTAAEATEWCVRVELRHDETAEAWVGDLKEEWLGSVRAVCVCVLSSGHPRRVADLVEAGDAFKLTAASQCHMRIRGVRLEEQRVPSPLLPASDKRLWFCAARPLEDDTWQDIAAERRCALTWSPQILPDTQAELYLILSTPAQRS